MAPFPETQILKVEELSHCLPDGRRLWDPVSFSLNRGDVLAVLGPNGAGKTTLLRVLLGLLAVQAGSVRCAAKIGYVPQVSQLNLPYRVYDVVAMGRIGRKGLFTFMDRIDRKAIDSAFDMLHLSSLADRRFTTLSGGERQLVIAARALASESEILLMDEPMAALDLANQAHLLKLLHKLAEHGKTIVFSTHQPQHALSAANYVLCLGAGTTPVFGPIQTVITEDRLRSLYGVEVKFVEVATRDASIRAAVPILHNGIASP